MDRRSFMKGAAGAAAFSAVTMAGLSGCGSNAGAASTDTGNAFISSSQPADQTLETEVLVVGLGTSGIMAAYNAAKSGAKVIAVDIAVNMAGTTNCNTVAPLAVASKAQAQANPAATVTVKEAYQEIFAATHYQENSKLLRNLLQVGGTVIDTLVKEGMPFMFANTMCPPEAPMRAKTGCLYKVSGQDRADIFTKMLDGANVTTMFGLKAESVLTGADGTIKGIRFSGKDGSTDIKAKAVVLATGGFLGNMDMVKEHFAGGQVIACGNTKCQGAGINMALALGAQMGKNFSVSMNEFGGANLNATPMKCASFPDFECNSILRLAIIAYPMVDSHGVRFLDEGIVCSHAMYSGEPLIRESTYYVVVDQALVDRMKNEPLGNLLNTEDPASVASLMVGMRLTDIEDAFKKAIGEGWAYKADTIAELGQHFGLDKLDASMKKYNQMCQAGEDTDFYKEKRYLYTVTKPPYYIIQYSPSAWLSLGGIKTDEACHALTPDNGQIPGLFISGADADLWSVPYVYPGSANGFCLASGWIAGESAAEYATH